MIECEQDMEIPGIKELQPGMRDLLLQFLAKAREHQKRLSLQDGFAFLVHNAKLETAHPKINASVGAAV